MNDKALLTALGIVRTGVGGALLAAPAFAGRIWVGPDADGPGTRVVARAIGARDLALGVRLLGALGGGDLRGAATHARTGVLADLADVAATLVAVRELEGHRRWAMPLIAATVGGVGVLVWKLADEAEDEAAVADGAGPTEDGEVGRAASTGSTAGSRAEELGIVDQQGAILSAVEEQVPIGS